MLFFLLDENISTTVAEQIKLKNPKIVIFSLRTWQDGIYMSKDDEIILAAASQADLTLVTYDQNTIPPILSKWGEAQVNHKGVIFIDYKSIPPSNFGLLIRSLMRLWDLQGQENWTNRLVYLKPIN